MQIYATDLVQGDRVWDPLTQRWEVVTSVQVPTERNGQVMVTTDLRPDSHPFPLGPVTVEPKAAPYVQVVTGPSDITVDVVSGDPRSAPKTIKRWYMHYPVGARLRTGVPMRGERPRGWYFGGARDCRLENKAAAVVAAKEMAQRIAAELGLEYVGAVKGGA